MNGPPVVAVTGLAIEARIVAGEGVIVVAGGQGHGLAAMLELALAGRVAGIISVGIAGGLDPALAPGALLVGAHVVTGRYRWPTDTAWSDALCRRLGEARRVDIAGVDRVVADTAGKRKLYEELGAAAVDMESQVAAPLAAARRLPFAIFRVVADTAHRSLPGAALDSVRVDGSVDLRAALRGYVEAPRELIGLPRTALDTARALRMLRRGRRRLGARLGFPDLDQLVLDVT